MYGTIDFYTSCRERGIKPIIGLEAYIAPASRFDKKAKKGEITANHITLLAKDNIGYQNLIQLASRGYTEGFYYKPRIDLELLKLHHKGIICLSGCIFSKYARGLLSNNFDEVNYMRTMTDIFGDDFYIECQDHGLPDQKRYKGLLNYEKPFPSTLPVVATNDVHYLKKEDAEIQDALVCIGTGTHVLSEKRLRFPSSELYMKSEEEMLKIMPKEWINRTHEIADKCNLEIELHRKVNIHDPEHAFDRLKELCDVQITKSPASYHSRYNKELEAIKRTGYAQYLLVVADFMQYARFNHIPIGSGRGSSAGSLICYLLGITEIDPIHYGLLFERFINVDRIEPPDIDVDISQVKRQEVLNYIKNEYGNDRVAQIIAFGSIKAKACVRDVFRVLQLGIAETNTICKMIPDFFEGTVDDVFKIKEIIKFIHNKYNQQIIDRLIRTAKKIEGRLRHSSTHAAGVVISDIPLNNLVPICKKDDTILTQYNMYAIEKLGLLKFDVLGLRTLDVIDDACNYAHIDKHNIPLDDFYTFTQLRRGKTFGVFQYAKYGYTKFIQRMQPTTFDHLIALGALYRPGPLNSGMADEFLWQMKQERPLSQLDGITDDTYGILLYQEQVMKAVVKYCNFTLNEADTLRKAIGKKDKELMDVMLAKIKDQELKDKIITFARYGWNKAHAVSYALLSYQTAYLKFNYPTEFYCALLNSELGDNKKIQTILPEACADGVTILSPNINISDAKFTLYKARIYGGLMAIKGVGTRACEAILEERKNGEYKSSVDLRKRIPPKKLNSVIMKILVDTGVFNEPNTVRTMSQISQSKKR